MAKFVMFLTGWFSLLIPSFLSAETLRIYHDADYTTHNSSAIAMQMGITTALDEINYTVQGYEVEIVEKDHRGNSLRSLRHMKQFLEDEQALFVLGGLHSPPYIKYRDFINEEGVLLLVPWAAGGPITRYDKGTNWVFRLSVDDTKASITMVEFAIQQKECKQPHLLLEDTPWGKSNFKGMSLELRERASMSPAVTWFGWNTRRHTALSMLRAINEIGADCILFVGNAVEGEVFAKAMASLEPEKRKPLISHWGITGGSFHKKVDKTIREKIDLAFIQTCFSFNIPSLSEKAQSIFDRASSLYPDRLSSPSDIPAPVGFIHAYDLGLLVIQALRDVELGPDMNVNRRALRKSLEQINTPVNGLIKRYQRPFSTWTPESGGAHEALGVEDFCMGYYTDSNTIRLF